MSDVNDVVHAAYLQDNLASDYSRHTGTAMYSMLEYCSKHAVIHLFHEERLSEDNIPKREEEMNRFRKMVSEFDAEIHFHNVVFPEEFEHEFERYVNPDSNNGSWQQRWKRIIFTRYFLQDFLPDVDRVIVLGSDTIVRTDVAKLLGSMPDKYSMGAVPIIETSILNSNPSASEEERIKRTWKKTWPQVLDAGLDLKQMMIGCVHILNLKKIRETGVLPTKALAMHQRCPDKCLVDDQVLSIVFHNDIYVLDERFNYYRDRRAKTIDDFNKYMLTFADSNLKGYILHYQTPIKPWDAVETFYDAEYWSTFYKTPWGYEDRNAEKLKEVILTPDRVYASMDEYVWKKPISGKIKMLWGLTFPLYFKIVKRYLKQLSGKDKM